MNRRVTPQPLLTADDPEPVALIDAGSDAPVLLLCEHAGKAVPRLLGDLGLPPGALSSHRGWDIGAEALARRIAAILGAPLILQRYSRLVVDCNRPPDGDGFILTASDGVDVPGNRDLSPADRTARRAAIFDPMNRAIDAAFADADRRAAFSIHSFTPELGGVARPWHAGFLSRRDAPTATKLMRHLEGAAPDLALALNEPYQIEPDSDWFIPAHAEPRDLAHTLIEVRNDQLRDPDGIARWADLLAGAIDAVLKSASPRDTQ